MGAVRPGNRHTSGAGRNGVTRYRLLAGFGCGTIAMSLTGFLARMPVSAQGPRVISGRVCHATVEVPGVAGLDVTLHIMGPDGPADRDVVADEQGRFMYEEPDVSPESSQHISARYQGALYGVNVSAGEGGGFPSVALPIYEAASDPEAMSDTHGRGFARIDDGLVLANGHPCR